MTHKELTPALEAELRFLRQQVDFWAEARLVRDASPSAAQWYLAARSDLTQFVSDLREKGFNI